MEKGTPHCKLAVVRRLIAEGKVRMTKSALVGGAALGFDALAIVEVVKMLAPGPRHARQTLHLQGRVDSDFSGAGDYCSACDEAVLDLAESTRTSALMLAFNREVNGAIVDPDFIASVRKKLALGQREAA